MSSRSSALSITRAGVSTFGIRQITFILPTSLRWDNPVRGFASLLVHTRQISPDPTEFSGPGAKTARTIGPAAKTGRYRAMNRRFRVPGWCIGHRLEPAADNEVSSGGNEITANLVRG